MKNLLLIAIALALASTGCHPALFAMNAASTDDPAVRAWQTTITNEVNDHEQRLQQLEAAGKEKTNGQPPN